MTYKHKRKPQWGGYRFPSEEKLDKLLTDANEDYKKRVSLYLNRRPRRVNINGKDLKKLREIGEGQWDTGFYRVLNLAHQCWLTTKELMELKSYSKSGKNAREGFMKVLELASWAHIQLEKEQKEE